MSRSRTLALVAAAGLMVSTIARAEVLTFHFTGRISDTVLQSGFMQPAEPLAPDGWLGQTMSGTFSMNLTGMEPRVIEPGYSQLARTADRPRADWLTVTVDQPDGSTLVIPSGPVLGTGPGSCAECDDAYSHIADRRVPSWAPGDPPQDSFYTQRTRVNGLAPFPRQQFQISLRGIGPEADGLVDSIDYRRATFNVGSANWDNYGYIDNSPSIGHRSVYAFNVLSLTSQVSPVPEPGTLAMAGVGAWCLLAARRRRHLPTKN